MRMVQLLLPFLISLIFHNAHAWAPCTSLKPSLQERAPQIRKSKVGLVSVTGQSNPFSIISKQKILGNGVRSILNFRQNLKKMMKTAVVAFTIVWILLTGEIVNAASGSGGRMGGSFKSSGGISSPYRPSTSFPSSGQIRQRPATRLYVGPGRYPRGTSYDGTRSSFTRRSATTAMDAKSYAIPIALYGSFFYVNYNKIKNREAKKDISVHKLSLAFDVADRDEPGSILRKLKEISSSIDTNSREEVQNMVSLVCLELMRQQSSIFAASSSCEDYANAIDAEKSFNSLSIRERSKFKKETISNFDGKYDVEEESEPSTVEASFQASTSAVVTIILSIEGSKTERTSKMYAWQHVWDAISRIGADMKVEDCLLSAEILWTPEKRSDVVTRRDIAADYPDLRII